jgi:ubiquinone/menaquinone biosynthesis C-methylase UbiE
LRSIFASALKFQKGTSFRLMSRLLCNRGNFAQLPRIFMCQAHSIEATNGSTFAESIVDTLNAGATALMISIGHRTGLFDALSLLKSATSDELSEATGLEERYVREWLGAMACAGILTVDAGGEVFFLPPEHAAVLTRAGGADNMAPFCQYVSVLGSVESSIVRCFKEGGGVPYESFDRFHDVMAEDSGQSVMSSLFESILPLVPGLAQRLSSGIDVLDLGCGQGRALIALAERFPQSRFVGIDLCAAPLNLAREQAQKRRLTNVTFEQQDATELSRPDTFDFIATFDAIHDQARPDLVLKNIERALRSGGQYLMQDINASSNVADNLDHPMGAFLYTVSTMHCMTVSLAQGGLGLGTMWGRERARLLLKEAGFSNVKEHLLDHDPQNRYYVMQKWQEDAAQRGGKDLHSLQSGD